VNFRYLPHNCRLLIKKMMKKILLILVIAFGLTQITKAQTVTCLPCDQLSMSVNVGSDTTMLSIYHAGHYLTHPQEYNVIVWEFSDMQGNIISQDTLIDEAFYSFSHNFPITDTMNVTVYLRNDSANLDNWYINQGLLPNGNSINCLFEDKIYWETGVYPSGTPWGRWEFITGDYSNPGVDLNVVLAIDDFSYQKKELVKIVDILGRETSVNSNQTLFFIYEDGTVEKRIILE
jgi:hypothetical protein